MLQRNIWRRSVSLVSLLVALTDSQYTGSHFPAKSRSDLRTGASILASEFGSTEECLELLWLQDDWLTDWLYVVNPLSLMTSRPPATKTNFLFEVRPSTLKQLLTCNDSCCGVQWLEVLRYRDRCAPCRQRCVHVTDCTWCELSSAHNVSYGANRRFIWCCSHMNNSL
jgi:hypothetical protein